MKTKEKLRFWHLVRTVTPAMMRVDPKLFFLSMLCGIVHSLLLACQVPVQQRFFDTAAALLTGGVSFRQVVLAFAAVGIVSILIQVINGVGNYVPQVLFDKMSQALQFQVNRKAGGLSAVQYEHPETLDDINKAEQGAFAAGWLVFVLMTLSTFYLSYFLFIGWYLFSLKPTLALTIGVMFVPVALTQILRAKIFAKMEDAAAPERRKYEYYERAIADREYFKETRLLGCFSVLRDRFRDSYEQALRLRVKAERRAAVFQLSMNLLTVLGYGAVYGMLLDALMAEEISVGAFAAVFGSIDTIYSILQEIIQQHLGSLAESIGTTANYVRFLELPERQGEIKTPPAWGDITLRNVSFTYPGADTPAIRHVSFTLRKGETLAVVGENGSGKSTLIRLLTGLYLPEEGSVQMNGIDTRLIAPDALYRNTSAVFQRYQRYQMTLEENVRISAWEQRDELAPILAMAGCDPEDPAFPEGYDTMLSREFDGVDLSGGQWQRVAIARGYYRNHNLIILDEPTAAIDPYEETRVYNRFAEVSREKSAVIVTHRIGSVRLADRILVMKDGEAVELGTHEELLAAGGEYHRLWAAQEQWYGEDAHV